MTAPRSGAAGALPSPSPSPHSEFRPRRAGAVLRAAACLFLFSLALLTGEARAQTAQEVPADWALVPSGVQVGGSFRLLFVTSTQYSATSSNIATYNAAVIDNAASGHAAIRSFSAQFRAVGCTSAVNARTNTGTTGAGVPIYWLNGAKVADNYGDFYDNSWDSRAGRNQTGASHSAHRIWTGCRSGGTSQTTLHLGAAGSDVRAGRLTSSTASPLDNESVDKTVGRPLYALSPVLTVVVRPPDAPAEPTFGTTTTTSIEVNWQVPNSNGSTITRYRVEVQDAGGSTLGNYTATGASTTSRTIPNLTRGTTYGFRVRAEFGTSSSGAWSPVATHSTLSGIPAAPAEPTFGTVTTTSIVLNWQVPSANGSTITSWRVEVRPQGQTGWSIGHTLTGGSTTSGTIRNLTRGTAYEFRVRAHGTRGSTSVTGAWSPVATHSTLSVAAAPAEPTFGTVTTTSIVLNWQVPSANGSTITSWRVEVRPQGQTGWSIGHTLTGGSTTSGTIRNLTRGTAYEFRVRAHGTRGSTSVTGAWSPVATHSTLSVAAGQPAAPAEPTFGTVTTTSIVLNWQVPSANGSTITSWRVEVRPQGQTGWSIGHTLTGGSTTSGTIRNLTRGTAYEFRVRAHGTRGSTSVTGAWSPVASHSTLSGIPAAPAEPTFGTVTTTSIVLNWQVPSANGSTITSWRVEVRPQGQTGWSIGHTLTGGSTTSGTIRNLTRGTAYEFRVRAHGTLGSTSVTGAWSPVATHSTHGPPDAPAPNIGSITGTGFTVSWDAPANNGAAIDDYDVRYRTGSGNWTEPGHGIVRTKDITGLTRGTEYEVAVRAHNTHGEGAWGSATATTHDVPAAPAAPTFSNVTATGFTASWTAPASDGGSPVTQYQYAYRQSGQAATTFPAVGATVTSGPLMNLSPLTEYQVRVQARNAVNWSGWSAWATVTTLPATPGAPTVTGASVTSVEASWSAVAGADTYDLRYRTGGGSWTNPAGLSSDTMETITGLQQNTSYQVQVRARKGTVGGAWSASGTGSTLADSTPPVLDSAAVNGTELVLTYGEALDTGSTPATGAFTVRAGSSAVTFPVALASGGVAVSGMAVTLTLASGVTDGQTVTVSYAVPGANPIQDAAGNDAVALSNRAVSNNTPPPPDAPAPAIANLMDTGFTVSWDAPADNGGAIDDYDIDYRALPGGGRQGLGHGIARTKNITGLSPGTEYEVRVRAHNSGGESAWGTATATTLDVPDAPAAPRVNATSGERTSLDVSWSAPEDYGSTISDYDVQYRTAASGSTAAGPWMPHSFTGAGTETAIGSLTDGTRYEVQVQATNGVGTGAWSPSGRGTAGRLSCSGTTGFPDFEVRENHRGAVGDVNARDNDGHRIVDYVLSGPDAGRFNNAFGRLIFRSPPDYENPRDAGATAQDNVYKVTMTATSGTGANRESASQDITVTVTNVDRPDVLGTPSADRNRKSTLRFDWEPPASDGGAPVTMYELRYRPAGAVGDGRHSSADRYSVLRKRVGWRGPDHANSTRATLVRLAPDTCYEVEVRAVNSEGPHGSEHGGGAGWTAGWSNVAAARTLTAAGAEGDPCAAQGGRVTPSVAGTPEVSAPASGGRYGPGERIEARVAFDSPVVVDTTDGTPSLGLALGGVRRDAGYAGGSGTQELTFALTVSAGDAGAGRAKAVANGIRLNGATVRSADGTDAALAFGTAPGVKGAPEIAAAPGGDGRWSPGETLEATLVFAEPVEVDGTPTLGVALGSDARRAAYARGSGTSSLAFAYTLTDADAAVSSVTVTGNSLALDGGSIRSTGGLDAELAHNGAARLEVRPPALSVADAEAQEGETLAFRVTLSRVAPWPVTVAWATADGTATAGGDYTAASGTLTFAPGETERTVEVALPEDADEEGEETLTLALSNPVGATLADAQATGTVGDVAAEEPPPGPAALTARFLDVPAEHDGESVFTFELRFAEEPEALSFRTVRDSLLAADGGTVKRAKRVTKGSNLAFRIHVKPAGAGDVTVTLRTPPPCGQPGSVCTADGGSLAGGAVATIQGPASLSVADAEAREGPGAALGFTVSLSRARHEATRVDYATADGTATAGADYTETSGTLSFAAGETERTVSVPVLDDAHDDDGETLTLALSNPAPAGVVRLGRATATGTIRNSDAAQKAWIARFGRTVTDHVLDAVEARLAGDESTTSHATIGGQRIGLDAGGAPPDPDAWCDAGSGRHGFDRGGSRAERCPGPQTMTGRELLTGSSFLLRLGAAEDGGAGASDAPGSRSGAGRVTAWGRAAVSNFDGADGDLTLDGEVVTGLFGADWARDGFTVGLALSHSEGEGGYRQPSASGEVESTVTALHPYLGLALTERLSVWAAAGYGEGEVTLTPENAGALTADLGYAMGAVGARSEVLRPEDGKGLSLAVKGDARVTRTSSDAVTGAAGNLAAAEADVWRLRLGIEGERAFALEGGAVLTPSFELGLRHDGGDAETGTGVEVGGGIAYADPGSGLSMDLRARGLLAHAESGYEEWGLSGSVGFAPGADGRGLSLSLTPAYGADAGGVDRLWTGEADALANLAANDNAAADAEGRLEAEVGYGLPAFGGRFTGTPHAGFALSDTARGYSLGWRFAPAGRAAPDLSFGIEAARRESDTEEPEHAVGFKVQARF